MKPQRSDRGRGCIGDQGDDLAVAPLEQFDALRDCAERAGEVVVSRIATSAARSAAAGSVIAAILP